MKIWVSLLILAVVFVNVSSSGHLESDFSQTELSFTPYENNAQTLSKRDLSTDQDSSKKSADSSQSHNCHLGHCSFILPDYVLIEPQVSAETYLSLYKQFTPIDLLPARKPPKV